MKDPRRWQITMATHAVANHGVIAYPTETVFGLGCNPNSLKAIKQLLTLKPRALNKGFIILVAHSIQLINWLEPDSLIWLDNQRVDQSQPTTWVIPCKSVVPNWITGQKQTIAVRITSHPLARELCMRTGPLISTSANKQGKSPVYSISQLQLMFKNQLDWVLPGQFNKNSKSSRIVDAVSGKILRA